eukprot:CAMPEP_0169147120 /NCGR_PEP_ID=MMETSP1015-20121227/48018_1 /TAXON_ID=342587 /ORGANISM="Karlodinium micrum, Strain CCMP2283" /LENGTH=46 /DNA_ID= /DNA_START= /DNA_END= /DNA_ORIENTATION=
MAELVAGGGGTAEGVNGGVEAGGLCSHSAICGCGGVLEGSLWKLEW